MPFNTQPPWQIIHSDEMVASRSYNIDYVNNTGHTLFVDVASVHELRAVSDGAYVMYQNPRYAQQPSAGIDVGGLGNNSPVCSLFTILHFVVPPGDTYQVKTYARATGMNTLYSWIESY